MYLLKKGIEIMLGQKNLQWLLAFIGTFFLIRVFYYTDPSFLSYEGHNVIVWTLENVIVLPILFWVVLAANHKLYDLWFGESRIKNLIKYDVFQKIVSLYLLFITLGIIYGNLKWID